MKKILLLICATCGLVMTQSCEDMDDCKVDTTIDTQVYIVKDGFQAVVDSNFVDGNLPVYIYKGGFNNEKIKVGLEENEDVLSNYNAENGTDYKALPQTYYSIGNETELSNSNVSSPIQVKLDVAAIKASGMQDQYVLPLVISEVEKGKVKAGNYVLIQYKAE